MDDIVRRTFGGDIVVSSQWGSAGIGASVVDDIEALPEIDRSLTLSYGMATVDGSDRDVVVTDITGLDALTELGVDEGSFATTGPGRLAVSRQLADDLDLSVGSVLPAGFADGEVADLTVGAVYRETDFMGNVMMHPADYLPHAPQTTVEVVLVSLADGVDLEAAKATVVEMAGRGGPDVQTRDEFIDSIAAELDQALTMVYGLLGLAVLIALMGIANTLALSVHERTREIGLLRAVGQSRRQLRSTVRWESVVTAALGAAGGLALGTFLGWGVLRVAFARSEGLDSAFTVPTSSITTIVVLAVLAGVLASMRPARRAARLDVLDALATV
jgi:putative ABC transport system permease protein